MQFLFQTVVGCVEVWFMAATMSWNAAMPQLLSFKPALGIIDEEKKVRHSKLADRIEEVITEPSRMDIKLKVRQAPGCPPA
jgi:hypothetical protein